MSASSSRRCKVCALARIDVSGVRSSWLTVATNSDFMRSISMSSSTWERSTW